MLLVDVASQYAVTISVSAMFRRSGQLLKQEPDDLLAGYYHSVLVSERYYSCRLHLCVKLAQA